MIGIKSRDVDTVRMRYLMSALPPEADMCSALAYVCFGPIADKGKLNRKTAIQRQLLLSARLWHRARKPVGSRYLPGQIVVDVRSDFFFKRGSQHSVFAYTP